MLGQSLDGNGGKERNGRERHASEAGTTSSSSEGSLKENRPDNNNFAGIKTIEQQQHNGDKSSLTDRLYVRGHCQWPGCDISCPDVYFFRRHLSASHSLDDKTTAQTRVQLQIVSQLELQLKKEKDRLEAMMRHLRLESHNGELEASPARRRTPPPPSNRSPSPKRFKSEHSLSPPPPSLSNVVSQRSSQQILPHLHTTSASSNVPNIPASLAAAVASSGLQSPLSALTAAVRSPLLGAMSATPTSPSSTPAPIRPKPTATLLDSAAKSSSSASSSPSGLTLPPGFDERRGRGDRGNPNLDPEMDIKLNRDFYMHNDVRPPYTYAALIRYVS